VDEPAPVAAAPAAEAAAPAAKAPRVATGGGTLFERMSSLSRGGARSDDEDGDDGTDAPPLNIPRFLGRQNNQ
jgi:cell division protein FtsZ